MSTRSNDAYYFVPAFCARNRRSVISTIIVAMVVSYQWESLNTISTGIELSTKPGPDSVLEPCVEHHVSRWDHGPARPMIELNTSDASIRATAALNQGPPRSNDALAFKMSGLARPSLALIGNKQVMVEVRKMEMLVAGEILPLPIASTTVKKASEVMAIDLHAGKINTVAKLMPSDIQHDADRGCVTLEEHWYAHRRHPGLIVRDIQFTNTLHQPVTIEMVMRELPSEFVQPDNVSFDPRKFTVMARTIPTSKEVDSSVRELAFVYTKTKSNFTLQPRMSTRRLLLLQCLLPEEMTGHVSLDAINDAVSLLERVRGPEALLKSHELSWGALWPLQLKATESLQHRPWNGQIAAGLASFYYLLSALDLQKHGEDEHPSDGGCYVGTALRLAAEMPPHPTSLKALNGYIRDWAHILRHGGCKIASDDGQLEPFRVVRSVAFGLLGLHLNPGGKTLYVADSTDLPPGLTITVGPIEFNDHKIELSLTHNSITLVRQDTLSELLYTSSFRGALEPFTPHEKKELPPHGVLVSNEVHDLELHWASGELDHGGHHFIPRKQKSSSYSKVLVAVLAIAVVAFHVFLAMLLFRSELCSSTGESYQIFNRLKFRKTSVGSAAPRVLRA
eukprot:m.194343 g.194343  ORF g.194343 m.194343 type:complete len:620 (+) comp15205_c0_seq4:71-1930(+)